MALGHKIIRYADDFVVLCKTLTAASDALKLTNQVLDDYQLSLNLDKSRVTDFDSGFVFLGHFFIGNLVQKLANTDSQLYETSWQWDNKTLDEEKYKHAFTGEPIDQDSSENLQQYAELQKEILDCSGSSDNVISKQKSVNLNLSNKFRTLYLSKQGSVVHKIGGKIEVRHGGDTLQKIPVTQLDGIMCFGAIHLTRAVILESFNNNLPIILMNRSGFWQGAIQPYMVADKELHIKLLESHQRPIPIAKLLLEAKLQNSITTIRRYLRYHQSENTIFETKLQTLSQLKKRIEHCKKVQSLRGIEGISAKIYFEILQNIIPQQWNFKNRNRQPPQDPFNAMLSLGYTVLFNNIYALVMLRGMIMEYGYLHSHYHKQPALALDMMEPFRTVIVDATVLKIIKNNILNPNDFKVINQACLLTSKAKKVFITALEKQMSKQLRYEALDIKTDYRRIMDLQILLLKQSLLGDEVHFKPFRIR
ncbi:MAG: CRISPR-associated endonuclease Cas1 [Xanthomonadales bacterium]|nr:CRISPR-associated endonuclease Cas1 [Xanthomonadales bacterium]